MSDLRERVELEVQRATLATGDAATIARESTDAILALVEADAVRREQKAFVAGWLMTPLLTMVSVHEEAIRRYPMVKEEK